MDDQSHDSAHDSTSGAVICRVCGSENRSNRLFCAECGTYLKGEEEDTWVDLPGIPQPGRTPGDASPEPVNPTWPSAGTPPPSGANPMAPPARSVPPPSPPRLAWDDTLPPSRASTTPLDYDPPTARGTAADYPPRPPRRSRHWLLATLLVVLLFAAAGVTGAVAYRALFAPDEGAAGDTSTTTTDGDPGSGSTTTAEPSSSTSGTSTTSTAPSADLGEPVAVMSTFASSTLPAEGENDYRDRNVIDGSLSTCWSEGVEGDGIGEWVRLDLDEPANLSAVEIANGYQKDERRFGGNPRVETLRIEYSDGSIQRVRLHDDMGYQSITPPPTPTEWVKLVIESTYPGDTWEDTSISEVRIYRRR